MERAGMHVHVKNAKHLTFVKLSSKATDYAEGIRYQESVHRPLEGQKVITLRQLLTKLLPDSEDYKPEDLFPKLS